MKKKRAKKQAARSKQVSAAATPRKKSAAARTGEVNPDPDTLAFTAEIHRRLKKEFGIPLTPLTYSQPHELAIAVILSAQCTDEQVNKVTPPLFAEFRTPEDFYTKPLARLEELVYSTGFYKNKAKNIREFARQLVEEHNGVIPDDLATLTKLPGIGRKTANVVLQELYRKAAGIVVDTHVMRLSRLLGLTEHKDAVKVERDLIAKVHKRYWLNWSLYLIFLGRKHCSARKRECSGCPLNDICPSSDVQAPRSGK